MQHVIKERLRETLFVLWFIIVVIKMTSFIVIGVEMNFIMALALLPLAAIGHYIGLKAHEHILHAENNLFKRGIGAGLLFISLIGLFNAY